jgi:acyl-CoA synthetase (AMP-forming)/AMP-acid ligase II
MTPLEFSTIPALLEAQAKRIPDRVAVLAPDRAPLTYARLYQQVRETVEALNRIGIGRGNRVALIANEGPELAVAAISVACATTLMLFKPSLPIEEYSALFSRAQISQLIIQRDLESAARDVVDSLGLPIIDLIPQPENAAGIFQLTTENPTSPVNTGFAQPDDLFWLAASSGTTDKPKLVPISHQLMSCHISGRIDLLSLDEHDRYLNMKPLYIPSAYPSMLRLFIIGGSIVCPQIIEGARFYDYLSTFQPTCCSATATIYQTILAHASHHQVEIAHNSLRFLRSGSMALPESVKAQLEQTFNVPVVVGYSSSETGAMAHTLLSSAENKLGSVGCAVPGIELKIIDVHGNFCPPDAQGEIVVRGDNVFSGYDNDPASTAAAFVGDWFRTGDLGHVDSDGYVFVTGRIKEQINRGGEKVSPLEVEAVLLKHPSIAEAAVFAFPDQRLGEDVGAAVVLRRDIQDQPTEQSLRTFAAAQLAHYKVPTRVIMVDSLPRTELGKIKRTGLAEKLGIATPQPKMSPVYVAPKNEVELQLVSLWSEILRRPASTISIHDEFLDLGGDSLSAARLISRIRRNLHTDITLLTFFDAPTIAKQAEILLGVSGQKE